MQTPHSCSPALKQYLERYAEPECGELTSLTRSAFFDHCLILPAYNESITCLDFIEPALSKQVLLIIVINQPDTSSDTSINQVLFEHVYRRLKNPRTQAALTLGVDSKTHCSVLMIDRFTHTIPYKQGVGLARKIGADCATALFALGKLRTQWLHTTDGDTQLPNNYFNATKPLRLDKTSAAVYPFVHKALDKLASQMEAPTKIYERSLHFYVDQLKAAGSPYAYHSLGSCLAINIIDYACVRGFPKRAAGEDFYLLNKLNKLKPITSLSSPTLLINTRSSMRTPFGTGPAVKRISEGSGRFYNYNPKSFQALAEVLKHFSRIDRYLPNTDGWLNELGETQKKALNALNVNILFKHLIKQTAFSDTQKHIDQWFDALKTLRFIHLMREAHPDIQFVDYDAQK